MIGLYRGKLKNGDWVEGNLLQGENCYISTKEEFYYAVVSLDGHLSTTVYKVDPKTVSQATGLKDKNGKMIFEGDEILCGTPQIKRVVSFECGRFGIKYNNSFYTLNGWIKGGRSVAIIGNIHDK